jgi:hypothetical protein
MDETALFSGYKSQRTKSHKKKRGGHNRKATGDPEQKTEKKKKQRDEQQQEKRRGRTPISWVQTSITIDHRLRLRLRFPIISQATT